MTTEQTEIVRIVKNGRIDIPYDAEKGRNFAVLAKLDTAILPVTLPMRNNTISVSGIEIADIIVTGANLDNVRFAVVTEVRPEQIVMRLHGSIEAARLFARQVRDEWLATMLPAFHTLVGHGGTDFVTGALTRAQHMPMRRPDDLTPVVVTDGPPHPDALAALNITRDPKDILRDLVQALEDQRIVIMDPASDLDALEAEARRAVGKAS